MEACCIRRAEVNDCDAIMKLSKDLAHMSKDEIQIDAEALKRDGFRESPWFHCYVAENERVVVGYILSFFAYSSWVGRMMYIEELYVTPNFQNHGYGGRLLEAVVKDALCNNCNRIEWGVIKSNENAIKFYKRRGAVDVTTTEDVHVYKLERDQMEKLIKKP